MVDMDRVCDLRMIRLKYSRDYFSALAKIQSKQVNGYSNGEYELTKEESEALRIYVNNREAFVDNTRRSR